MIKTFTQNDLVRYLYNETTNKENEEIAQALLCDAELQANWNDLKAIKKKLADGFISPSTKSVDAIMEFSRLTKHQGV